MSQNYYTPQEVAGQSIQAVHQRPLCANEDSIIVGRFDSAYAFANFPKLELQSPHAYVSIILDCDSTEGTKETPCAIQGVSRRRMENNLYHDTTK